jgi:ankyrin repeat protein
VDNFQATPLLLACANGYVDIARMLLQRGASTSCISEAILTMKCDRDDEGAGATVNSVRTALINLLISYAWIPSLDLQRSCQQNDVTNVRRLLTDYPILSSAVYHQHILSGSDDIKLNIPLSAPLPAPVVYGGGASPLMVACLANALNVVKFLVSEYPVERNLERIPLMEV